LKVRFMSDIWSQALGQLRTTSKRSVVDSWFDKIAYVAETEHTVQLGVPDTHFLEYIEAHWLQTICDTIEAVASHRFEVQLLVMPPAYVPPQALAMDGSFVETRPWQPSLLDGSGDSGGWEARGQKSPSGDYAATVAEVEPDPLAARFTLDNFVIGQANQLAASAARTVAETPGLTFNPLFIHGGVGIGKTHLLHAIGHLARQKTAGLRVLYVAAETYIDDLHSSWRSKDNAARSDVRNHYRNQVDLLLVDDIQFLQGREKIQEEFFHLFNALHQAGKQIVLTCDRYPSELQNFHDRLRSRFDWGLVAEMSAPDRDLRGAILRRKALDAQLDLPLDVVQYLADHLRNNVRELEGALNKLAAHSRIGNRRIDLALARSVLGPMIELPSRNLTVEVIQRITAQHFNLKVTDLKGSKRHRTVVVPRMIAIFLTRKHTSLSYPDIGRAFGGRDHSTAIHSCQKIEWQLTTDPEIQAALQAIEIVLGK
jgi:chromosomal replication initiator protein